MSPPEIARPGSAPALLELKNVSKGFGGVAALRDVDFTVAHGEIHGLVGENGAGKSTLMKIIAGMHHDFEGQMLLEGRQLRFRNPHDSLAAGIGMVHQELSIVPDLTVAENVFLGTQPTGVGGLVDWAGMAKAARRQIGSLGLDIDPRARMGSLPVGIQQLIELSRVLFSGARIIILDEPTSALSPPEVDRLFNILRQLRNEGRSLIFISHFLEDVLAISDRVTILRNGRKVAMVDAAATSKDQLISQMIGRGAKELSAGESTELSGSPSMPVVLSVQELNQGSALKDLTFDARAGEILGIYGFMGCGQIELARCLFGKLPLDGGTVRLEGNLLRLSSTVAAREAGIAYVPENRRMMLFPTEPIYKNISISILQRINKLWLKPQAERDIAKAHIADLQIRPGNAEIQVGQLSGGNQQKVALAKWLTHKPKVLILSEPTRGMDVGAKEDVIRILKALRDQSVAVIVLSTEPETILTLADRVLVMKRGRVVKALEEGRVEKADLLAAA
ncbi:MAG: sugar ABC transporter ATP-binding protein [Bradyrhizobium sp.]|jgi:ribose transport system ATP-binding protein